MNIKFLTIILLLVVGVGVAQKKEPLITKEQAIDVADKDLGFGNTWLKVELKKEQWQLYSAPNTDNPPMYYVVSAIDGKILLRVYNADDPEQKKKLKRFLKRTGKEDYVEPEWVQGVSKILHVLLGAIINFHV